MGEAIWEDGQAKVGGEEPCPMGRIGFELEGWLMGLPAVSTRSTMVRDEWQYDPATT
jgi:hypothetical protein